MQTLAEFIADNFVQSKTYNKVYGSYFLKHRWEEYSRQYAGVESDFIKTLESIGYKTNKYNRLKLRPKK